MPHTGSCARLLGSLERPGTQAVAYALQYMRYERPRAPTARTVSPLTYTCVVVLSSGIPPRRILTHQVSIVIAKSIHPAEYRTKISRNSTATVESTPKRQLPLRRQLSPLLTYVVQSEKFRRGCPCGFPHAYNHLVIGMQLVMREP